MKYALSLLAVLFINAAAFPEELYRVSLLDGSLIKNAVIAEEKIEVQTRYGKLTVPWNDVRNVKFGIHYPDGKRTEIENAIKELGMDDFKVRERATHYLTNAGRYSYPLIKVAHQHPDMEVASRSVTIFKKIEEVVPASELRLNDYDLVTTKEGVVIKGVIIKNTMKVKTPYLGELNLHLSILDEVAGVVKGGKFQIDSSRYGVKVPVDWFDTGIDLEGSSLDIKANGQIDLWTQAPGQYVCGPKGHTTANGPFPSGALIGKVGNSEFFIGESFVTGDHRGRLYLRVNPSSWAGANVQGIYEVQIKAR